MEHHLQNYPGTVIAVTHDAIPGQCGGVDPGAGSGEGIPWKGKLFSWLERSARLQREEKSESKKAEDACTRTGVDSNEAPRAARKIQGQDQRL